MRSEDEREQRLGGYELFRRSEPLAAAVWDKLMLGLSTRNTQIQWIATTAPVSLLDKNLSWMSSMRQSWGAYQVRVQEVNGLKVLRVPVLWGTSGGGRRQGVEVCVSGFPTRIG